jgi:outer membrane protein OmpA-like peptidoglycan-associated protein
VLTSRASEVLDGVVEEMSRRPRLRTLIRGHTDTRGNEALNIGLSRRRAEAVAAYLGERGVARDRMVIEGVGESQPADRQETLNAMARNRRVQVIWR